MFIFSKDVITLSRFWVYVFATIFTAIYSLINLYCSPSNYITIFVLLSSIVFFLVYDYFSCRVFNETLPTSEKPLAICAFPAVIGVLISCALLIIRVLHSKVILIVLPYLMFLGVLRYFPLKQRTKVSKDSKIKIDGIKVRMISMHEDGTVTYVKGKTKHYNDNFKEVTISDKSYVFDANSKRWVRVL